MKNSKFLNNYVTRLRFVERESDASNFGYKAFTSNKEVL